LRNYYTTTKQLIDKQNLLFSWIEHKTKSKIKKKKERRSRKKKQLK
jgi:hypothetical protein